jgi:ankyrin repeat protein
MFKQIMDGRTDLVFPYLEAGHPSDAQDSSGVSLIQCCHYHGDTSAVRYLLLHGESLDSLGPNYDLNGAVFHGHWQLCQFLIEMGADVNYALKDTGETPLHAALCKANRPVYDHVLEILLANGADPNVSTIPGAETGAFMRDCYTKGETPLHRAAAFGTEQSIQLLLAAGASPTAKDMNDDTPLAWASWHLRPAAILRNLCYGRFSIHPQNQSSYDHSSGWGQMDSASMGKPHLNVK